MRIICRSAFLAMLLVLVAGTSQSLFAVTRTVGFCAGPGTHYSTIGAAAAAVSAANAYPATIDVCPGSYPEQITISVAPSKVVTLTGIKTIAGNQAIVTSPSGGMIQLGLTNSGSPFAAQLFVQGGGTVNVNNIIFDATGHLLNGCDGTYLFGVIYQNTSGTMDHITTRFQNYSNGNDGCQFGLGIYAESNGGTSVPQTTTVEYSSVHDYDKDGITANGAGLTMNVSYSSVIGYGPVSTLAQNGIEYIDGATGTIKFNTVTGDRYTPATFAASGILLYDSGNGVTISGNQISQTDGAIAAISDGSDADGPAASNTFTENRITQTTYDGIDACSPGNTITTNTILQSGESGIHIDTDNYTSEGAYACISGSGNLVHTNTITETCAGVLLGTAGAASGTNTYWGATDLTLAGDSCPAVLAGVQAQGKKVSVRRKASPSKP